MKKILRRSRSKAKAHAFILIPWHIGNRWDVTLNAVRMARGLRYFVTEDAEDARFQFSKVLKVDCAGKTFVTVPYLPDQKFLEKVLKALRSEDVGMVSSGGVPCFSDPGGWLVRELQKRGERVVSLGGASCLTTLLSLSGFDWIQTPAKRAFSFIFFQENGNHHAFREVIGRRDEPVIVFVERLAFAACIKAMKGPAAGRQVSAFFDLTKTTSSDKYPYADQVLTMTCADWLRETKKIRWAKVSDVALMVHPEESGS